ncbi:MAG: DUF4190 domain-containing protein [Verrucomicrobia bacterium]|nr:DUF4190 domain-containing protein [Verrucomicrobiota bacterium]
MQSPTRTRSLATGATTSRLAVASLVLSIATIILGPFGCIPGIICGHLAKARIRRDPRLTGKGLATAGLAVGYGFIGVGVIFFAVFGLIFLKAAGQLQQETKRAVQATSQASAPAGMGSGAASDGWTADLSGVSIPTGPLNGRLHGHPFHCDQALLSPVTRPVFLTLRQGPGLQGDLKLTLILSSGIEGQTVNYLTTAAIPAAEDNRVELLWRENGQYHAQSFARAFNRGFVLRLECAARSNNHAKGRLYLCLGDGQQSYVAGTFDAQLQ